MSLKKKAIRQAFRDAVFTRDNHCCVFCSETKNLDAHHIVNRNQMHEGGYILSNGVTLCPRHHIDAESGEISVEEIRAAINT